MYIDLTLQSLFFSLPFPFSVADFSAPASSESDTTPTRHQSPKHISARIDGARRRLRR
jgi:hypothetical protein